MDNVRSCSLAVSWAQTQTPPKPEPHSAAAASTTPDAEPWEYSLTVDGYIIEGEDGYASPTFTADRGWLHLEARYNYENFRTGSLWAGYNFSWGKNVAVCGDSDDRRRIRPHQRNRARMRGVARVEEADLFHRQ